MKLPDGTATPKDGTPTATPASEDATPKVDTLRLENLRAPATRAYTALVTDERIVDHVKNCPTKIRVRALVWWLRALVWWLRALTLSLVLLGLVLVVEYCRWRRR